MASAFLYVFAFIDILDNGETVGHGFQAIVQSDTMLFKDIFQNFNVELYIDANVKNTILPVYMWTAINGNWYISVVLNVLMLAGVIYFLGKIAELIEIKFFFNKMLLLILLPETFIYLIGILKEIPTLFFFTAVTFFFLKKNWVIFFIFFIFLILFRYQFAICIALFIFGNIFWGKNNIRFLFVLFAFLSASYPFLVNNFQVLGQEDANLFREMGAGSGIGQIVEIIQKNIYGLSFIATLVKFFQMMVEPLPFPNLFDSSGVNIIAISYSISAIIWLTIWYKYFKNVIKVIKNPGIITPNQNLVLSLSFSFLIMVALNSFVHHRYLYPGMGLILIISFIPLSMQKQKL
jgi:hypothetical protein